MPPTASFAFCTCRSYGRIAFACPGPQLQPLEAAVRAAGHTVLTPFVSLDTPGKATVQVRCCAVVTRFCRVHASYTAHAFGKRFPVKAGPSLISLHPLCCAVSLFVHYSNESTRQPIFPTARDCMASTVIIRSRQHFTRSRASLCAAVLSGGDPGRPRRPRDPLINAAVSHVNRCAVPFFSLHRW